VLKFEMLFVVHSEFNMVLKRILQDEDIEQELSFDWL
jgi:hypothetical protein